MEWRPVAPKSRLKNPPKEESKKKDREEKTYLDVLQGLQKTLKGMINTQTTRKQSQAPKGATASQATK